MASTTADRCQVNGTTTGVGGTLTCGSAQTGYRTFVAAVTAGHHTAGDYIDYVVESDDRTTWEVRYGTVGSGGTTLTYTGVRSSSTGSAINWTGSGTLTCYETVSGARMSPIKVLSNGNTGLDLTTGTITSSNPALSITQTWNEGSTQFIAAKINITDTASATSSNAFQIEKAGTANFTVDSSGRVHIGGAGLVNASLYLVTDGTMRIRQSSAITRYRADFQVNSFGLAHTIYDDTGGAYLPAYFDLSQYNVRINGAVVQLFVDSTGTRIGADNTLTSGTLTVFDSTASTGDTLIKIKNGAARAARLGFTAGTNLDIAIARSAAGVMAITDGSTTLTNYADLVLRHLTAEFGTAIPAGGTTGVGLKMSSTANFGVFFGSGAPTLTAAQGSLYMRSEGSSTSTRVYVNTDGGTTWTNLVTAA